MSNPRPPSLASFNEEECFVTEWREYVSTIDIQVMTKIGDWGYAWLGAAMHGTLLSRLDLTENDWKLP